MLPAIAHPVVLQDEDELADCLLGIAPDSFDSALRHLLEMRPRLRRRACRSASPPAATGRA
jgi:hypothetical protein